MQAWQRLAESLDKDVNQIKRNYNPTVQFRYINQGDIVVSKRPELLSHPSSDPWPNIVSSGIKEISQTISSTIGSSQKDRIQLEKEYLGLDKLIISALLFGFLASLGFSFYLIYMNTVDPIYKFIFPLLTGIFGLISGYLAGRGRGGKSGRS